MVFFFIVSPFLQLLPVVAPNSAVRSRKSLF
jgi:hypothetical protein